MLMIISPAKNLNTEAHNSSSIPYTQPAYLTDALALVKELARMSPAQIGDLMDISRDLAGLNYDRFQTFSLPFTIQNSKQSILTFNGHTYQHFELDKYQAEDYSFAQSHLRILSGLYGLLRPLDLIQPYRLEMGTRLANKRGDTLYAFWKASITAGLNLALEQVEEPILVNLASNEYFGAVDSKDIQGRIVQPLFKEERNGGLKTISVYAKQARGAMCNFAIRHAITKVEDLKTFNWMGYSFNSAASSSDQWTFSRVSA